MSLGLALFTLNYAIYTGLLILRFYVAAHMLSTIYLLTTVRRVDHGL